MTKTHATLVKRVMVYCQDDYVKAGTIVHTTHYVHVLPHLFFTNAMCHERYKYWYLVVPGPSAQIRVPGTRYHQCLVQVGAFVLEERMIVTY